jgi:hypothetical protein
LLGRFIAVDTYLANSGFLFLKRFANAMVSNELLQELKEIIKEEYGRNLSMEEVSEIGNGLVGYFDMLAKMNHENNQNNENKHEISTTKI